MKQSCCVTSETCVLSSQRSSSRTSTRQLPALSRRSPYPSGCLASTVNQFSSHLRSVSFLSASVSLFMLLCASHWGTAVEDAVSLGQAALSRIAVCQTSAYWNGFSLVNQQTSTMWHQPTLQGCPENEPTAVQPLPSIKQHLKLWWLSGG